jgi:hypothetical protein
VTCRALPGNPEVGSAYKGVWQLQELMVGATGMTDTDYIDLGEFPTPESALAHIEGPTQP